MAGEVELISDGEGVVVVGEPPAVQRFLSHTGLAPSAEAFDLSKLGAILRSGAEVAKTASGIAEQSAAYLKLTPESAKRLRDAGGLMKTKSNGISHAMLGDPGKVNKWLQVEDGPRSLLTNPAVLAGVGGLISQVAQQAEAQELKALLVRLDRKLDDVQQAQRDTVLAKLHRAAAVIDEAMTIHRHGGDPGTLWSKVSGESATIAEVQNAALLALAALATKVHAQCKPGELKKMTAETERNAAVQLAILARCFELQDEFRVIELDHVLTSAPEKLEGHRCGIAEARETRRAEVLARTSRLIDQMDAAGKIASENILLHARAARSVIDSLNSTAEIIDDFHAPLGIASGRDALTAPRWREAVRDPQQLKRASLDVGQATARVGGAAAVVALGALGAKNVSRRGG